MSWLYRVFKLRPYTTSSRSEGKIQIQKVNEIEWDTGTTIATVAGNVVTLNFEKLTKLDLQKVTALNLDSTAQPTLNFTYSNIGIFASTATPWLTAANSAGTAGPGSLWLCTSGSMYIKVSGTGTTGWMTVTAVST